MQLPVLAHLQRLTPRGVSGLKSHLTLYTIARRESHPSRGEWIEIGAATAGYRGAASLTPRGVSGLKLHVRLYQIPRC